jgi:hypothetical protein
MEMRRIPTILAALASLLLAGTMLPAPANAAAPTPPARPNILMIMSDDVGITNVGA